jgi:U3 small nucleolar ribonucleoprotein component
MIGEISSKHRPFNSLLEENLEMDYGVKPAPSITKEITDHLEDRIKRRILDETWDDVIIQPTKSSMTTKMEHPSTSTSSSNPTNKEEDLDFDRPKKSLAELYELDYTTIAQRTSGNTIPISSSQATIEPSSLSLQQTPREMITSTFRSISAKLDALTHFHFTPNPIKEELQVIPNVAALTMEEPIPTSISRATLLAPEEIYSKPKRPLKSANELTGEERHRIRLDKKRKRRTLSSHSIDASRKITSSSSSTSIPPSFSSSRRDSSIKISRRNSSNLARQKALNELRKAHPKQVTLAESVYRDSHHHRSLARKKVSRNRTMNNNSNDHIMNANANNDKVPSSKPKMFSPK